ncbi:MAG: hypothetical protein ACYTHM_04885 [Planctomycetota bacterium]|jgi:hypothetical protein
MGKRSTIRRLLFGGIVGPLILQALLFAGEKAPPSFRILVITPEPQRGKNFKAFLEKHGLPCTVLDYDGVQPEHMKRHDLVIADSAEGPHKKVFGIRKGIDMNRVPLTDRPVIGVGTLGYQYLKKYGIALGKVKT